MNESTLLLSLGLIVHNGRSLVKIGDCFWLVDKAGRKRAHRAMSRRLAARMMEFMEPDRIQNGNVIFRFKKDVTLPEGVIVPNKPD